MSSSSVYARLWIYFLFLVHAQVVYGEPLYAIGGNADELQVPENDEDPAIVAENMRNYITDMIEKPFPKYCGGSDESEIREDEQIVRIAPCHEKGAVKHYSFDGKFEDGRMEGKGVLKISQDTPEQQRCLIIKENILDLPSPDVIEGYFIEGYIYGIANLTWTKLSITMNAHVTDGILHGMFKAHDKKRDIWMLGQAERNEMSDLYSWLVYPEDDEVWWGKYDKMFQMDIKNHSVHIFSLNMTNLIIGKSWNETILVAKDARLNTAKAGTRCQLSFSATEEGFAFDYDLKTKERRIGNNLTDLCLGKSELNQEEIQTFFFQYFDNMQPVALNKVPIDFERANFLLDDVQKQAVPGMYEATLNMGDASEVVFKYFGKYDNQNQFHGFAQLEIFPVKTCFKGICNEIDVKTLRGTFQHGKLNGLVSLISKDSYQITYLMVTQGVVHGIVPTYGVRIISQLPERKDYKFSYTKQFRTKKFQGVGKVEQFINGHLVKEHGWIGVFGEPMRIKGYLYGKLDDSGTLTGDDIAYIYANAKMALKGRFEKNKMISAQKATVSKAFCKNSLLMLDVQLANGDQIKYHHNLATNNSVGDGPLIPEPYEAETVYLDSSTFTGAGHGLFAKRNIQKGELVSFYNGFQLFGKKERQDYVTRCESETPGVSKQDIHEKCHKYTIATKEFGGNLDLPPWLDDINLYNATLSHKVNHKFYPESNAAFCNIEHPRFGPIPCVYSFKDIKANEEIFVDYGYDEKTIPFIAKWYQDMYYDFKNRTAVAKN